MGEIHKIPEKYILQIEYDLRLVSSFKSVNSSYGLSTNRWMRPSKPSSYKFLLLRNNLNSGNRISLLKYLKNNFYINFDGSLSNDALPIIKLNTKSKREYKKIETKDDFPKYSAVIGLSNNKNYEGGELVLNPDVLVSEKTNHFRIYHEDNCIPIKLNRGECILINNNEVLFKSNRISKGENIFCILPFNKIHNLAKC